MVVFFASQNKKLLQSEEEIKNSPTHVKMSVTHKSEKNGELHRICFSAERVAPCPTRTLCNSVQQTRNRDRELKTSPAWIFQLKC